MRLVRSLPLFAALLFAFCTSAAFAQLTPFNDKGVTMGHIHLIVPDPEAHKKIWVDIFGAQVSSAGGLELIKMPGIIVLINKGTPAASGNPVADHFAFLVRDLAAMKSKLAAANIQVTDDSIAKLPDGVRMELIEDKKLAVPMAFHHFHILSADAGLSNWYMQHFGVAFPAAANFPGGEMRFGSQTGRVPSKGYAFDHISFEVKDLREICKKLEAAGIKLDMKIFEAPEIGLSVTFVTDPVGTRIELTEGLAGK
jgi:catechol 2,3-dioxygenase-like lactoylglutathione lyase family enzyme